MAVQGPDNSWALGPNCQGGYQSTVVVPLGVLVWGLQWEWVALGMVQGVLAGLMA